MDYMKWIESKILPGLLISDTGLFKSAKTGKLLKTYTNSRNGYSYISFVVLGKTYCKRAHRLIANAHIPNPGNHSDVNHKDGNKSNNSTLNLEWCSRRDNIIHAFEIGLKRRKRVVVEKSRDTVVKITSRSRSVIQKNIQGDVVNMYPSIRTAAVRTGVNEFGIHSACSGRIKSAGGFLWTF